MSSNTISKKMTFLQLITNYKIEIPIIQRDYAQGRVAKEEIRNNFLKALHDSIINEIPLELDFVYGSLKDDVFQPLDGQQRLTTLFLLQWYVGIREDKLDDECKGRLSKFSYETRSTSREFCMKLVHNGISNCKNKRPSESIRDSPWFFISWEKDPTIKSMLIMLDSIHYHFENKPELWDKLKNVSFQYIELKDFGLSDDLYIKMNARGKALTDFENFKAKFEQYLQKDYPKLLANFSKCIDGKWTDLFWNYRGKIPKSLNFNLFDEEFMNFFRVMATNNYALKNRSEKDFESNIEILLGKNKLSLKDFMELKCFDDLYIQTIITVLDKLSEDSIVNKSAKIFLPDCSYVDEVRIFEGAIANKLPYADMVVFYAYTQYLNEQNTIDESIFSEWLRVIRNLVEASRLHNFNNAKEYANILNSVNSLLPYKHDILTYFAMDLPVLPGFRSEDVIEEVIKAQLILKSNIWKNAIFKVENHGYFKGQIGFLLNFAGITEYYKEHENVNWNISENENFITSFLSYCQVVNLIFNENGLQSLSCCLFERALLTQGDYLLDFGYNKSFLRQTHRDISWKRLLRDDKEQRNFLKILFDHLILKRVTTFEELTQELHALIDNFNDAESWKFHFIKQGDIFIQKATDYFLWPDDRLIRMESVNDILLLGSTKTSGYHVEYYSYALFLELKTAAGLPKVEYKPQKSKDYRKYFNLQIIDKKYKISYLDKNYFITVDTNEDLDVDWDSGSKFNSREDLIYHLEKLLNPCPPTPTYPATSSSSTS